jgi:hypothetical protein
MTPSNVIAHSTLKGRIAYLSDKPADFGRERGWEDFTISKFEDGTMTQRATCLISDAPHVVRDVIQTCDSAMRPLDCFVRVRTSNTFTGSGWFRWSEHEAECESFTAAEGRLHERETLQPGPVVFCNHAIIGDAWMSAAFPFAQGSGTTIIQNMYTPSRNKQGATGPTLNRLVLGLMWHGSETISVKAGTFETNKFRLGSIESADHRSPDDLTYEMWVLKDGSHVPALTMYRGDRRYELVSYKT